MVQFLSEAHVSTDFLLFIERIFLWFLLAPVFCDFAACVAFVAFAYTDIEEIVVVLLFISLLPVSSSLAFFED